MKECGPIHEQHGARRGNTFTPYGTQVYEMRTFSWPQREAQEGSTAARVVRPVPDYNRRTTSNGAQESSLY